MELRKTIDNFSAMIKKYKYLVLVLAIGCVLMIMPSVQHADKSADTSIEQIENAPDIEGRLSEILSKVEGAGEVMLMLTIAEGEEIKYQEDEKLDESDSVSNVNRDTIIVTDSERNQNGLVKQVNPAVYKGAIIVCQGADSPVVRLALIDALSKLTGLTSDKISVLKMI